LTKLYQQVCQFYERLVSVSAQRPLHFYLPKKNLRKMFVVVVLWIAVVIEHIHRFTPILLK
jgi:hypothetical protein